MFQQVRSVGIEGIEAALVTIEVVSDRGLPRISIVGLPDRSIRESLERIRTALSGHGVHLPHDRRLTINLAPAWQRKEGAGFDLPIAVAIAAALLDARWPRMGRTCLVGELALDGSVRPVRGILSMLIEARRRGIGEAILSPENAQEACVLEGIRVYAARDLGGVVEHLCGAGELSLARPEDSPETNGIDPPDFEGVRGQELAKRALVVACAGEHNILLQGPPGTGKTLLSRCLPGILSPMTDEESLEVTSIHSVAGLHQLGQPVLRRRPWRAPHHTISEPSLIGGGRIPRPGEVSLAHHGVLFLDEFPELDRRCRESLREPLETGAVQINRGMRSVCFPAKFLLVAARNPCPCGQAGEGNCRCPVGRVERYLGRISGPVLDRIDIQVRLRTVPFEVIHEGRGSSAGTDRMREQVEAARAFARSREERMGSKRNGRLCGDELRRVARLGPKARHLLRVVMRDEALSARAHDLVLRLARTVADLEGVEDILERHLAEAIGYRVQGG